MASRSMPHQDRSVTIGIDTHGDAHVAAAFTSDRGRPLGHLDIPTTPSGYRSLLEWARGLGSDPRFGVERTKSYGAGLARFLAAAGCTVIEVNRPNRQTRYARGKSDPVDAEAAARAVLSGEATGLAKVDTDSIGMIRALRVELHSPRPLDKQ
jgi:transposase